MAKPVFATNDVPTAAQFNEWLVNVRFARRTSTASIASSTTLVDDSQLTLPVDVNAVYELMLWLNYDGDAAGDMKIQINLPASATYLGHLQALILAAASQQDFQSFPWSGGVTQVGARGAGASATCFTRGIVTTAGTSGNVTLSWAQNTSSATATRVFVPSYLSLTRME